MINQETIFDAISQKAPDILTRKKLSELTGGIYSEKTWANLDSLGTGITPRLRIGSKVAYPKDAAIAWLKQRCEVLPEQGRTRDE